jgi:hypothetical protein
VLGGGLNVTPLRFALSAVDELLGGRFSGAPPSLYLPLFICACFSLIPFLLGRNSVRCGGLLSLFFVAPADVGRRYFGLAA